MSNSYAPAAPEHAGEFHLNFLFWVSAIALVVGAGAGFALYAGKDKDPLSIPLLKNRFYIDGFYDNFLVRYFQDAFAAIVHFFDEFLINGLLVGGLSRGAASSRQSLPQAPVRPTPGLCLRLRPRRHPRHLLHGFPLIPKIDSSAINAIIAS